MGETRQTMRIKAKSSPLLEEYARDAEWGNLFLLISDVLKTTGSTAEKSVNE